MFALSLYKKWKQNWNTPSKMRLNLGLLCWRIIFPSFFSRYTACDWEYLNYYNDTKKNYSQIFSSYNLVIILRDSVFVWKTTLEYFLTSRHSSRLPYSFKRKIVYSLIFNLRLSRNWPFIWNENWVWGINPLLWEYPLPHHGLKYSSISLSPWVKIFLYCSSTVGQNITLLFSHSGLKYTFILLP